MLDVIGKGKTRSLFRQLVADNAQLHHCKTADVVCANKIFQR